MSGWGFDPTSKVVVTMILLEECEINIYRRHGRGTQGLVAIYDSSFDMFE